MELPPHCLTAQAFLSKLRPDFDRSEIEGIGALILVDKVLQGGQSGTDPVGIGGKCSFG